VPVEMYNIWKLLLKQRITAV